MVFVLRTLLCSSKVWWGPRSIIRILNKARSCSLFFQMGREVHRGALPPPPGRVRIALLQTCAKDDKEHNLKTVKRLLDHTSQRPVQVRNK